MGKNRHGRKGDRKQRENRMNVKEKAGILCEKEIRLISQGNEQKEAVRKETVKAAWNRVKRMMLLSARVCGLVLTKRRLVE